jgi:hypothetical protein
MAPLSAAAVAELAGGPADDLHALTGGNPFYVTELLAAGAGGETPATVRDAVLARVARLDPQARRLLDAAAVLRPRAEVRPGTKRPSSRWTCSAGPASGRPPG